VVQLQRTKRNEEERECCINGGVSRATGKQLREEGIADSGHGKQGAGNHEEDRPGSASGHRRILAPLSGPNMKLKIRGEAKLRLNVGHHAVFLSQFA
jgi:hypothetical protein